MIRSLILLVASLASLACAGPSGEYITAEDYLARERAAEPTHDAEQAAGMESDAGPQGGFAAEGFAGDPLVSDGAAPDPAAPATRSVVAWSVERELAEVRARMATLALERDLGGRDHELAQARAQRDLRHAREDLAHFEQIELQRLLDEDAVHLAELADELDELREELRQLDALYGAVQPEGIDADLLARLRRRVERAEVRLDLAQGRSDDLRVRELPRRLEALRAAVDEAEHAALSVARFGELRAQARAVELEALAAEEQQLQAILARRGDGSRP